MAFSVSDIDKIGPYLTLAVNTTKDPLFPAVLSRVLVLRRLLGGQAVPTEATTIDRINLRPAYDLLGVAIYLRRNRWVLPLAAAAILAVPAGVGYGLGRARRSRAKTPDGHRYK